MVGGSSRGRKSRAPKKPGSRGRGRPSAAKDGRSKPPSIAECFLFRCTEVLDRLKKKDHYNIFLKPVNVAGYRDVIKNPMDFSTMGKKLQDQQYKSLGEFRRDLDLIWSNCLCFNGAEPNNVFSKKAIELRKVTEKLIASTRSSLEKDKEELYRWKERHRRQREQSAGLVPGAIVGMPNSVQPGLNLSLALSGAQGSNLPTLDSPVPGLSPGNALQDNRITPEAAFEYALKQLLRVQYGSNTGLYEKDRQETLPQHYIAPDGSAVQIPSVRYNPSHSHWEDLDVPRRIPKRKLDMPDAIFHKLGPRRRQNSCHPGITTSFVKVKDFVESVRCFVGNAGEIPNKIVDEFLAPELAVRDKQRNVKRRKLEAAQTQPSSQSLPSKTYSNSNTLTSGDAADQAAKSASDNVQKPAPADALMGSCKVSIFPRMVRKIAELDGEEGLAHLIGSTLTEEVKNVPISVVDFAMPFGVSLSALTEILHLAMDPRLGLNPDHVRALDEVRRSTAEIAVKISPQIRAAHGGASVLSSQEIHETQMNFSRQAEALSKAISLQQSKLNAQRRHEVQVLAESMRKRSQASIQGALSAAGDQLPPIISASAQSMLPEEHRNPLIERRLQEQNAKSIARTRNSVNAFQARNAAPPGSNSTAAAIANVLGHTTPIPAPAASAPSMQNAFMKITSGQMPPMHNSMHMGNITGNTGNPRNASASNLGTTGSRNALGFNENGRGLAPNPFFGVGEQHTKNAVPSSSQGLNSTIGLTPDAAPRTAGSNVMCHNCGVACSQAWRLGGPSGKEQLCDACGLHWDRNKIHRVHTSQPGRRGIPNRVAETVAATSAVPAGPATTSDPAPAQNRRQPQPRQPGTGRFAFSQNGTTRPSATPAMHASLMNPMKSNAPVAPSQTGGMSRGIPEHLRGLQVPLSGMMNSMPGNQHVASQIGKEIDSFSLPGLLGEDGMQRRNHGSQANNVQKFSQMNPTGPGVASSQSVPNSLGGPSVLPSSTLRRLSGQPTLTSNSQPMHLGNTPFNQNGRLRVNASTLNPNFGNLSQQISSASGQARSFNPSQSQPHDAAASNPLAGLPPFMTDNGSGLSLPPNTAGMSSMGPGVGSVGRALQGHALRPPPRDNLDSGFFSSNDQHQNPNSAPTLAADNGMAPLVPLSFDPPPSGNNGHMNREENGERKHGAEHVNTAPQIDNLFLDGASFEDGNAPPDFGF